MSRTVAEVAAIFAITFAAVHLAHRLADGYWAALAAVALFAAYTCAVELVFRRRRQP